MPKPKPLRTKSSKSEPIHLVGTLNTIRTFVDGGVRISFDVPQTHQKGIRDIMEAHGRGEVFFAIACLKMKPDDTNVVPLDPVDKVFSEVGEYSGEESAE